MVEILINGCSFTALDNQWPDFFPLNHKNIALGGNSNDQIFLTTIEELQKNNYNVVIVMWSFLERTHMSTANHEIKNILVNSPIGEVIGDDYLNPGDISGSKIEQALDRFKKDYFQYFYSDQIQQRKLDVYQHCVSNSCERVIHLNVRDVTGNMDKTGHPTSDASKDFAQKLMDTYFNE